jgi:cobaltochelatase CobS
MKDQERLECKECGFKSDNLVPHIEIVHADLGDEALDEYCLKHSIADMSELIHPDLEKKPAKKVAKKAAVVDSKDSVTISGIKLKKGSGGIHVPAINPAYCFSNAHNADIMQDINENKRVMLTGHTGCGKTSVITQIAARANQGVIRLNLNGQMTVSDFQGYQSLRPSETGSVLEWVDGWLPYAMREGLWLILDEIDFGDTGILAILNSVLEPNGFLTLKENGREIVQPHKDFRIFATANTAGCMSQWRHLYAGTNALNEAFLDRFRVYHADYLPPKDEKEVLINTLKMPAKVAGVIVKVANQVRKAFLEEEIQCTFSLRRMLDWSELIIRHKGEADAPMRAASAAIFSKISHEDTEVIKGVIQRNMNTSTGRGK